jgi:hypothetical protein
MRSFSARGVTLIDVLVGSALVLIIFLGLFAVVRASLAVTTLARMKSTATTMTEKQMEYIRSLNYDAIGTVGGIPAGLLPQSATTSDSGITFTTRTFIEYHDDAADGLGSSDANGITTDYKQVKVTTSYVANGAVRSITLASTFAPPGIETTTGGGTLQANVVNQTGAPVAGASVRVVNASTSPTIDVTTFSDSGGVVQLPGAATSTGYQLYVSKDGYSSAQTYARTGTNVNPNPGYLTVTKDHTTTGTFAIDLLASLTLRTFTQIAPGMFRDLFTDSSSVGSLSGTAVSGGALTLSGAPGTYSGSGSAIASTTAPSYLATWQNASSTLSLPAATTARVQVVDGSGAPLPDSALLGNSTGFTGVIDLSGLSTTTYPALSLKALLTSSDPNVTPSIEDWGIGYTAGPTPLPNVAFTLTGGKTIGSTAGGASIYKTTIATSTDASGVLTQSLEWDSYTLSITGHTILSVSTDTPFDILPGTNTDASVILTP